MSNLDNIGFNGPMVTELYQLTKSLQYAIRSGDENSAKALVQQLTLKKAPVVINLEEMTTASSSTSIRLRVQFEDRTLSGPSIDLHVNPQTTIGAVKCLIYDKLKFPPEVQRCIVGKRMRHNKDTLASCGLTYDGCVIFLYILSAETVGLHMEDEAQDNQSCLQGLASQSSVDHPPRNSMALVDNVQQIYNVGAGMSQGGAVPLALSPAPFSPNAAISSPQAQASPDAAVQPQTVGADMAQSVPAPTAASESNIVQQIDSSHSMSSATHSGDGDDAAAAAVAAALATTAAAENIPADEAPWSCEMCTYLNHGCMMMCELCSSQRPGVNNDDAVHDITDDEWIDEGHQQMNENDADFDPSEWMMNDRPMLLAETRRLNNSYNDLLQMETCHVVANCDSFNCPICLDKCEPGHGVVLRECLHMFCSQCLEEHVRLAESSTVKCPFNNGDYACTSQILDREIKALVSPETYQKYLQRSLQEAECRTPNSYHCATPNCTGWCTFEDDVNSFFCYACSHDNCLTCRAIHEDMDCADHQRQMKAKFQTDHAARMAEASLEELLKFGEALKCPTCGIIIMKKEGCDWIMCTMCKTEICWVTRQARWGPKGAGDTSGGCRCRVNGRPCHPDCQNCH